MVDKTNNWMSPEEALSRFNKPTATKLSRQDEGNKSQISRYGFVIDNMGFLIAENTLSEVVKNLQIYPIPNTQIWMKGLVNLRGNLVPVYDFSNLLGLEADKNEARNLLVLGNDALSVAVLIDKLPRPCDVASWEKIDVLPRQLPGIEEYIEDAYLSDDIVWMDFDQKGYFESIKQQVAI